MSHPQGCIIIMLLPLLFAFNPYFNHALAPATATLAISVKRHPMNQNLMPAAPPGRAAVGNGHALFGVGTTSANDRSYNNILMMVRGGGDTDDSDTSTDNESDEYDVSESESEDESDVDVDDDEAEVQTLSDDEDGSTSDDDGEEAEEEEEAIINQPSPEQIERAQKYNQLSSQSRNFGIATALYASLFFDTVLNKAKRLTLFPVFGASSAEAAASLSATMIPTVLLASGFGLAFGVAFLLWRDMDIHSDMIGSDDGESAKGDWFLTLSSPKSDDSESSSEKFASQTRARLCLHLSLFGILSLCANAGYYFSDQAPFLGMSAAIINVHNTLASVSALMKEEGTKPLILKFLTWPVYLFKGEKGGNELELTPLLFRLSAIAAWVRCIPVCKSIISLGSGLLPGGLGAATTQSVIVDNSRQLALQIASLARLTLAAGVSHALSASSSSSTVSKQKRHPFFAVLSGFLGLGCLSIGGTVLFDTLFRSLSSVNNVLSEAVVGGILVAVFGVFASYNSVVGFLAMKNSGE